MATKLRDYLYRGVYGCGFRAMRVYWRLAKPETHGAAVALWHEERVLMVRNSYKKGLSLPGGGVHGGESPKEAARRELFEEVGVSCHVCDLKDALDFDWTVDHKRDHLTVFELKMDHPPTIQVDNREVIWAGWFSRAAALREQIAPQLRAYFEPGPRPKT